MKRKAIPILTILGFAFLYLPIISLIVYSFNRSKLVSVWGGFSTKWYGELFKDDQLMSAAWISIKVAIISASIAVILGTLAAYALVRFRRFRGRLLLDGMVAGPLVMPDVIIGLSLLLLFVTLQGLLGWPSGRGIHTVIIAHSTFCSAYVAVVVRARLLDFDYRLEEAAMDLGARPTGVFFKIILPIITPALISGYLLSFTLSFDDLVIASFTNGPGSSTLPMVIFSRVRFGVSPEVNVLATLFIGIIFIAILIAGWRLYAKEKKRQRDMQLMLQEH